MKTSLSVLLEVSSQTRPVKGGALLQTCYVDSGGKYPAEDTIYIRQGESPLDPGQYVANRIFKKGFDWVLDLDGKSLTKVAAK
jgi:hypothetical protein